MKISTVLPTYNEAKNIVPLIERLIKAAEGKYDTELIVVDDDSPDKTWQIAEDFAKKNQRPGVTIRVIHRTSNRGLPQSIAEGIRSSTGDATSWMDCDLSHTPELLPIMVEALEQGSDIAMASRYVKGGKDTRPFLRIITSRVFNWYANILLSFKVKDYTTGYVIAKKEVFENITISEKGYGEYCVKFLYDALRKGYSIKEIPYIFKDRVVGESKTKILKCGWDYGTAILRMRFKR